MEDMMRILFLILMSLLLTSSSLFGQLVTTEIKPFAELKPLGKSLDTIKDDFKRYTISCRNSYDEIRNSSVASVGHQQMEKLRHDVATDCQLQSETRQKFSTIFWGARNVTDNQALAATAGWTPGQIQEAVKWRTKVDQVYKELSEKYRIFPDNEEVAAVLKQSKP
jgi:hypothetical protein